MDGKASRSSGAINWVTILKHTVVWILILLLPYILRYNYDHRFRDEQFNSGFFWVENLMKLIWIPLFYFNAYWLTPRFFYTRRYTVYALFVLAALILVGLSNNILFRLFDDAFATQRNPIGRSMPKHNGFVDKGPNMMIGFIFNLPALVLTLVASLSFRLINDKAKNDLAAKERQEENLKTELSFLRSQISPHFVFNILNNITALARLKSDALEPTVVKLSSLMRYMLYETNAQKVTLQTEVGYLQSYIDLQAQRFGSKVPIGVQLHVPDSPQYNIEPMLLIPFVENAFKHGTGIVAQPQIDVKLDVKEDTLFFDVRNKFKKDAAETKDDASGIGLANVQRRLNLLYGDDYLLEITQPEDGNGFIWFIIQLQIKLKP